MCKFVFFLYLLLSTISVAIGPASLESEWAARSTPGNGVFHIERSFKIDDSDALGIVDSTGFLIELPNAYKHLEGRVGVTCAHLAAGTPGQSIFIEKGTVSNATFKIPIQEFTPHPNFENDMDFIDLGLLLLPKPMTGEFLTPINYEPATTWQDDAYYEGLLTSFGPSTLGGEDFKNRTASIFVGIDSGQEGGEQANNSKSEVSYATPKNMHDSFGNLRKVLLLPYRTVFGFHVPNVTEMPEILAEILQFKKVNRPCTYFGDSGSRLMLNNGEVAITSAAGTGEIEGYKVSEMCFTLLSPHVQWLESVLKTWSNQ